jgi:hypothetical protein
MPTPVHKKNWRVLLKFFQAVYGKTEKPAV